MSRFSRRGGERRDGGRTAEALRHRLAEQSRQAPPGDHLAELIIARAEAQRAGYARVPAEPVATRRPWGRVVAVAASVALIAGAGVAIATYEPADHDRRTDQQAARTAVPTSVAPTPDRSTAAPVSSSATARPTRTVSKDPAVSSSQSISAADLTGVDVLGITFTGGGRGWGLASADCVSGPGTCTALLRTGDDGRSWSTWRWSPFRVPGVEGTAPLVSQIRFATDRVGYVYGPDALLTTTDGGRTWQRQRGGADALETLDGNVIRVRSDDANCVGACDHTVQTADIGSSDWTTVRLPGDSSGDQVQLSRTGSSAYLLVTRGSQSPSALWSSDDDGATWTERGEVCGGSYIGQQLTTGADGSVAMFCRGKDGRAFVTVSPQGAKSFVRGAYRFGAATAGAIGLADADTVLVSTDDTYRSTDGGTSFARLGANAGSDPGVLEYLGFASTTDAHAISADGRAIWSTSDAGRTWTRTATFR
ncbi:beta propeller repeat protein [Jatrophihabitans fulvus]